MIAIYTQVVLHDLGCHPGGSSQRDRASSAIAGNGEVNPDSEYIPTGQNTTKITM